MTRRDIIVIGGGLNGTALALSLADAGLNVVLIDPTPRAVRAADDFDGRSYALANASMRLLRMIGMGDALEGKTQPILGIKVSDGRPGEGASPLHLAFDHAEIEEGPMGFMIEDRHLRQGFLARIDGHPKIEQIEARVTDHGTDDGGAYVLVEDGKRIEAEVILAADGVGSPTAVRAGIRRTGWSYDQTALVCAVAHEKPHNGVAHQLFLPHGPLAILPLTGNRSSIVWTEKTDAAAGIQALDDAAYLEVLKPRFGSFLGPIELAGARFTYPLMLSLANSFVGPRLALLGDAAHRVHPIAGQGLNAGLKDIAALAEVLVDARRRGEDIGRADVLERYQRWRRFDVATLAMATDGFNRLFSNDNPLLRAVRDIGLGVTNALPGLRRGFIREAAGLTGDLPRLMQGRPL